MKQVLKIVGVPREAIRTKDVGDNWRKPGQDFLVSKSFDVTLRDFTLIDEILKRVDTKGIHTMYIDKLVRGINWNIGISCPITGRAR